MGNSELNKIMRLALLGGFGNRNKENKKTNNKPKTTPFLNRGLRRIFIDSNGVFIVTPSKNGKTPKKQYLEGAAFAFKNVGYRIIRWKSTR
jgi:hypothetical protein